jgi:hypothetical protein
MLLDFLLFRETLLLQLIQYPSEYRVKKRERRRLTEKYWGWELAIETKPIWVSSQLLLLFLLVCCDSHIL